MAHITDKVQENNVIAVCENRLNDKFGKTDFRAYLIFCPFLEKSRMFRSNQGHEPM